MSTSNPASHTNVTTEGSIDYAIGELKSFVDELVLGRAVAYVGAGVSASANLPNWDDLLSKFEEAAAGALQNEDPVAQGYFKKLRDFKRSLEIGDWLLDVLGPNQFQKKMKSFLGGEPDGKPLRPS